LATGVVYQGDQISNLYDPTYLNFSPRVGFSYQLTPTRFFAPEPVFTLTPQPEPLPRQPSRQRRSQRRRRQPWRSDPVVTSTPEQLHDQAGVDPFRIERAIEQLVLDRQRTSSLRTT
jgi:hypothetical protein